MKAHHISIIIAILMMVFFVQPNKVNMNLTTQEVMDKVEQSPQGIESFVQKSSLQTSIVHNEETQLTDTESYRLEHRKIDGVNYDYSSGSTSFLDPLEVRNFYFVQLLENDEGYYSEYSRIQTREEFEAFRKDPTTNAPPIEYGPWEMKPAHPAANLPYEKAKEIFIRLAPEMELQEAEKNYIFSMELDDLSRLEEANPFYFDQLLQKVALTREDVVEMDADDIDFRIRFVVERHEMRIQNAYFLLRTKEDATHYLMQYSTDYEQFNIVGEPQLPTTAPALP